MPYLRKEKSPPLKDAGKGLEHIYDPKGHVLRIRLMTPLAMKNRPKSQPTLKLQLQANQTHVKPTQKTNFATTPNM